MGALMMDPKTDNHYFSMYEAFHAVVQKRQKQLDAQLSPAEVAFAVQDFKIWFIPAIKGPFKMMHKHNINFQRRGVQMLAEYTQRDLHRKFGEFRYLIKITGQVRINFDLLIDSS